MHINGLIKLLKPAFVLVYIKITVKLLQNERNRPSCVPTAHDGRLRFVTKNYHLLSVFVIFFLCEGNKMAEII